jgi:hypothetical protein
MLSYAMGLGHDRFDADLGAWKSDHRFSELNQRGFYRRWAQLMAAGSWGELPGDNAIRGTEHG